MAYTFVRIVALLLSTLLLHTAVADAQEGPTGFDGIVDSARAGQRITVSLADGGRVRGEIVAVTADSLTVDVEDSWGAAATWRDRERRTLTPADVTLVRRSDPLWNGTLIGLGAGLVGAEVFVRQNCGPRGNDDECAAIASLVGYTTFPAGGAAIGALIDTFIGNQVLFRSDRRAVVGAASTVSRSKKAVLISISF